jgi:hypothetical protein
MPALEREWFVIKVQSDGCPSMERLRSGWDFVVHFAACNI